MAAVERVASRPVEVAPVASLRPHPRNYRSHPADQLAHICASVREHGFYRPVVAARDGTILAGHGLAEAARLLGIEDVPVVRLDLDPDDPRALKVMAADNELVRFAETDDRALSDLLREIRDGDPLAGLLGTGYDDQMLASLVYVTRPEEEIPTLDHAAEWARAGMPGFEEFASAPRLVVSFDSADDRERFLAEIGVEVVTRKDRETWSVRWPPRPKEDLSALFFAPAGEP